jgi:hypothetical protein
MAQHRRPFQISAPRIFIPRNADALRGRAGVHVAIVDVPAVMALGITALGPLLKRGTGG